ncbi:MAG: hypothetical protein IIB87_06630 [Chloroflexi bacterium]|nr:hypothetical protein [Chloroflexota bacterium]
MICSQILLLCLKLASLEHGSALFLKGLDSLQSVVGALQSSVYDTREAHAVFEPHVRSPDGYLLHGPHWERRVVKKLLHEPIVRLKSDDGERYVVAVRELFNLDDEALAQTQDPVSGE